MARQTRNPIVVRFKRLHEDALIPMRKTSEAVGFDIASIADYEIKNINVHPKATKIKTGIALDIPKGYHAKLFLRSSTGLNTKLRLANGTGIIDSDYKGEVIILAENNSRETVRVAKGDRIAQILIERDLDVVFEEADEIAESTHKGFGSTGRN